MATEPREGTDPKREPAPHASPPGIAAETGSRPGLGHRLLAACFRRLPSGRPTSEDPHAIARRRRRKEARARIRSRILPPGARPRRDRVGGVGGEWMGSPEPGAGVLLFLHGGGFVFGSPRSSRGLAWAIHRRTGLAVYSPRYRLAPEDPYPAALEDTRAAYEGLLSSGHPAERVGVVGESAGGGLALSLALLVRDSGRCPAPSRLGLLCPWLDLTLSSPSVKSNREREPRLTEAELRASARAYAPANELDRPLISPLFGDLHSLPPILVQAAGDDLLVDDAVRLAEAATRAGSRIRLEVWRGRMHGFQTFVPVVSDARQAVASLARFLVEAG